jgi:NDP-sugar pyrophosphorylase family protein
VPITISGEIKPLSTCGPILLLKDKLDEPFILMNGEILTKLNFKKAYDRASDLDCELTVVTKQIVTPFHFGNVTTRGDYLLDVQEKPDFRLGILSAIYILKPGVFSILPEDRYYSIDDLIKDMLKRGMKIGRYLPEEYWLDIGRIEDYRLSQQAYNDHFRS